MTSPSVGNQSSTFIAKKLWPSKIALPKNFSPEHESVLASKDAKLFKEKFRKAFESRVFNTFQHIYSVSIL